MRTALRFIGGDAYLPGVPALDLSDDQLAELTQLGIATRESLIATGLYAPVETLHVTFTSVTPIEPQIERAIRARKSKE